MSKKLLNKVISAILVLAICSTAFLGCVVSAADVGTVNVAVSSAVLEEGTKVATSKVTISSEAEFVAGIFTVSATDGLKLSDASINNDGWYVQCNTTNNKVLFQAWTDADLTVAPATSAEITLTFDATMVAGTNYEVSVTELDITNITEDTYTVGTNTAGNLHIHKYEEEGEVIGNVTVYECIAGCGATISQLNEKVDIDDVRNTEEGKNDLNNSASLNITFTQNGDLTLNFLNSEVADNTYVAVLDGDNSVEKLLTSGGKIDDLNAYQVAYTEGGVKSIADEVKITFVKTDAEGKILSASEPYTTSVATYCTRVIDAVTGYTDKEKNYCKALLNYGKAANDYFEYGSDALAGLDNKYVDTYEDLELNALDTLYQDGSAGWYFASANVIFENKPIVRLCVNVDKDVIEAGTIKFNVSIVDGEETVISKVVGVDGLVESNKKNRYYIYVRDIPAKYYDATIDLTDNVTEDTETFGKYSLETYAANMAETEVGDLSRIMIAYGKALAASF